MDEEEDDQEQKNRCPLVEESQHEGDVQPDHAHAQTDPDTDQPGEGRPTAPDCRRMVAAVDQDGENGGTRPRRKLGGSTSGRNHGQIPAGGRPGVD